MKILQVGQPSRQRIVTTLLFATFFHIGLSLLTKSPTVFVTAIDTAKQIIQGRILYSEVEKPSTTGYAAWPPVFPYSLAIWFLFLGTSELAEKLFCVMTTIVAGYMCYLIGKEFLSGQQAYFAMVLFLFNPYTMLVSLGGHFENYAMIFCLLAIWAILRNHASLGGVALGIGIMTKIFPGLLLISFIPYWVARRKYLEGLLFFTTMTLTVTIIALPFLIICPKDFFYWNFEFHAERDQGGLSTYYYWLPWLFDHTALIFGIQAFLLSVIMAIFFLLAKKQKNISLSYVLIVWVPIVMIVYFCTTRILYPRYLAMLTPFISWQTVVLWDKILHREAVFNQLLIWLSMVGTAIWTLPAYLENWRPKSFRPVISLDNTLGLCYWLGAVIFSVTLFLFLCLFLFLTRNQKLVVET